MFNVYANLLSDVLDTHRQAKKISEQRKEAAKKAAEEYNFLCALDEWEKRNFNFFDL